MRAIGKSKQNLKQRDSLIRMMKAAYRGKLSDVEMYLEQGIDLNATDRTKKTVLMAVAGEYTPYMACGDFEGELEEGYAIAPVGPSDQRLEIASLLLSRGAKINQVDENNRSPLYFAICFKDNALVQLFLKSGANIQAPGCELAHSISVYNSWDRDEDSCFDTVCALVAYGADVNRTFGEERKTPLMFAAEKLYYRVAEFLLTQGADPTLQDKDGYTARRWAETYGRVPIFWESTAAVVVKGGVRFHPGQPADIALRQPMVDYMLRAESEWLARTQQAQEMRSRAEQERVATASRAQQEREAERLRAEEAQRIEHQRIEQNFNQVHALYLAAFQTGQMAEAHEHCRSMLHLKPDSISARFELGLTELQLSNRDQAASLFEAVIRQDPGHVQAQQQLTRLQQQRAEAEATERLRQEAQVRALSQTQPIVTRIVKTAIHGVINGCTRTVNGFDLAGIYPGASLSSEKTMTLQEHLVQLLLSKARFEVLQMPTAEVHWVYYLALVLQPFFAVGESSYGPIKRHKLQLINPVNRKPYKPEDIAQTDQFANCIDQVVLSMSRAVPPPSDHTRLRTLTDRELAQYSFTIIEESEIKFSGEILGRGGFGEVEGAVWQQFPVATKRLQVPQLTKKEQDEFLQEAQYHAKLQHENIVKLFGVCVKPCFIVMELMINGSLFDLLHKGSELPWGLRITIAKDIVAGLMHLHGQRILHRDLKSPNVLLNDRFRAKLCDFGLAKMKSRTTMASMRPTTDARASRALTYSDRKQPKVGTLAWSAPESLNGEGYSERSDIYAVAVILWELATQHEPFEDYYDIKVITSLILQGKRGAIPECPFTNLIARGWSLKPAERPTLQQIATDLEREAPPEKHSNR